MGCNCKNNSGTLAWVVGNDVLLKLWLWEKTATKEYKQTTLPFPLEEATELVVVARADYGKEYPLPFSLSEDSENSLLVEIPSTLGVGTYSLCVKCVLRGRDACSLEEFTFQIVRSNKDANVTFERIGDARQAEYSMEFQMVPSAVARGANAYELWLEQGHEGSIDDFLDYYIATLATEEVDGLMSKEDKKKLDDLPSSTELESKLDELDDAIGDEQRRAEQAEQTLGGAISGIESKIPEQASEQNQLADKNFVNSSISTATAIYRGAYNLVSDLGLTTSATEQRIAAALATKMAALGITPDNNDYCFVQVPTADATPTQIERVDRYKFNGTAWLLEFSLNNSGFTAAQWAALNSGITTGLVTKLIDLPTNSELTTLLNGKQAVISDLDAIRSGAAAGATAYQKPSTGIPANDIAPNVIPDVSNFITKSVDDLLNYYLKSETYTKQEVQGLIAAIQQFHYEIYASTSDVTTPQGNVLYLIGPTGSGPDKYEEYVYDATKQEPWVKIGDTSIDLSGYYTSQQTDAAITQALNTALADYTTTANLTTLLAGKQDVISDLATIRSGAAAGATAYQKPQGGIPSTDMSSAVQTSLGKADSSLQPTQQTLTEAQKQQARNNIGAAGVDDVPTLPNNVSYFSGDSGDGIVPTDGIRGEDIVASSAISVSPDVVTAITGEIGSATTITLVVPNDSLRHVWDMFFTTASDGGATIVVPQGATLHVPSGYSIASGKTYEVRVIGVGNHYYLTCQEYN